MVGLGAAKAIVHTRKDFMDVIRLPLVITAITTPLRRVIGERLTSGSAIA
jgi:hypothetical protein